MSDFLYVHLVSYIYIGDRVVEEVVSTHMLESGSAKLSCVFVHHYRVAEAESVQVTTTNGWSIQSTHLEVDQKTNQQGLEIFTDCHIPIEGRLLIKQ